MRNERSLWVPYPVQDAGPIALRTRYVGLGISRTLRRDRYDRERRELTLDRTTREHVRGLKRREKRDAAGNGRMRQSRGTITILTFDSGFHRTYRLECNILPLERRFLDANDAKIGGSSRRL